jgi:hypothetical protein
MLACNISASQESTESAPNVADTEPQSVEAPTEHSGAESLPTEEFSPTNDSDGAEAENPENNSSSESGGVDLPITGEDVIRDNISIKNGNQIYEGNVSFPGNNTNDEITIKPIDFDSTKASGQLVFTLSCSGRGRAKVNYKGGAVRSGAPGCDETWTVHVIDGSPDSHISIRLDASGDVNWTLSVVSEE